MFGKGMGNMAGMMKKVQKMQADMKKMQEELKTRTVEASVGGGAVTVVMNGEKMIESLKLNPSAVDPVDCQALALNLPVAWHTILWKCRKKRWTDWSIPLLKLKGQPAIVLSVLIYLRRTLVNFARIQIEIKRRLWWLKRLVM